MQQISSKNIKSPGTRRVNAIFGIIIRQIPPVLVKTLKSLYYSHLDDCKKKYIFPTTLCGPVSGNNFKKRCLFYVIDLAAFFLNFCALSQRMGKKLNF
jgi:hypothetical protein